MPLFKLQLCSYYSQKLTEFILKLKKCLSSDTKISVVSLPTKRKVYCILTSPHVNKDSREHFALSKYKKNIYIDISNKKTLNSILHLEFPSCLSCNIKNI